MTIVLEGVIAIGNFTVYGLLTYYLAWLVRLDESRFRGEDEKRPYRRGASGVDNWSILRELKRESSRPSVSN